MVAKRPHSRSLLSQRIGLSRQQACEHNLLFPFLQVPRGSTRFLFSPLGNEAWEEHKAELLQEEQRVCSFLDRASPGNSCNVSHLSMLFSVLNHVGFLSVALCHRRRHGTTIRSIARIVVPSGMSPRPCFCTANSLSGANFAVIPQKTNFSAELGDFFSELGNDAVQNERRQSE